MSVREIAASFEITCDGCKAVVSQHHKNRPPHWVDLHILRDAYDFQGAAVADASVKRLLCDDCASKVFAAINAALSVTQQSSADNT